MSETAIPDHYWLDKYFEEIQENEVKQNNNMSHSNGTVEFFTL